MAKGIRNINNKSQQPNTRWKKQGGLITGICQKVCTLVHDWSYRTSYTLEIDLNRNNDKLTYF